MGLMNNLRQTRIFNPGALHELFPPPREINPIQQQPPDGIYPDQSIPALAQAQAGTMATRQAMLGSGLNSGLNRVAQGSSGDNGNTAKMNHIFNPPASNLQRESLSLRKQELASRDNARQANQDIQQQRLDISQHKADNPNLRIIAQKDGRLIGVNPVNGQMTELGKHSLSETERIAMNNENAIKRDEARYDQQDQTATTRQSNTILNKDRDIQADSEAARIAQEGRIALETAGDNNEPGSTGGNNPLIPSQEKVRLANTAQQVLNSTPEFRKYLRMTGTNEFQLRMPQGGNQQEFDYIRNKIYGTGTPPSGSVNEPIIAGPTGTTGVIQQKVKSNKTGEIKTRISNDGGKTWSFK